jgi:hypothetical protein
VLESIPKPHRTPEFVMTWAKRVSVTQNTQTPERERKKVAAMNPVFFELDKTSGKAVVEFSSSEVARAAWSSPRLEKLSMEEYKRKYHGKGKNKGPPPPAKPPRLDFIRAWWYRVDGVGAGSGVGELEEGEVEGDDHGANQTRAAPFASPSKQKNTEGTNGYAKGNMETEVRLFVSIFNAFANFELPSA